MAQKAAEKAAAVEKRKAEREAEKAAAVAQREAKREAEKAAAAAKKGRKAEKVEAAAERREYAKAMALTEPIVLPQVLSAIRELNESWASRYHHAAERKWKDAVARGAAKAKEVTQMYATAAYLWKEVPRCRSDEEATQNVIAARALGKCAGSRRQRLCASAEDAVVPPDVRKRWSDSIAAVGNAQREAAPALVRLGLYAPQLVVGGHHAVWLVRPLTPTAMDPSMPTPRRM